MITYTCFVIPKLKKKAWSWIPEPSPLDYGFFFKNYLYVCVGRYSDSLRAARSGDRIPAGVGGARFFATVQSGLEVNPASYTMGTGSFPGVKRPKRGVDRPPPISAEDKYSEELYICSHSGHS